LLKIRANILLKKQNLFMKNLHKIIKKNIVKISTLILFFTLASNSSCYQEDKRGNGYGYGFQTPQFYQNSK